ncbi:hypothetical protein B0H13DRAFT_1511944, partial [Mycena leptocephala]
PQLPAELMEAIISAAWRLPMSSNERILFMRASALVNSTWADVFDLVSSHDVYIPSGQFCDHFIQRLRTGTQPPAQARSANLACQSITIQITNPAKCIGQKSGSPMRLPMSGVLDHLLENIDVWSLTPNLRRLSIEYVDAGFEDIFKRAGLAALPTQLTHLDLRYAFNDATPGWFVDSLRMRQKRQRWIWWIAPFVTRLSVSGAGENTVQDVLRVCPNAQILEVD